MKKIVFPIVVLALFGFNVILNGISNEDRNIAVKNLENSKQRLIETIDGLNEEQLTFKPDSSAWSIAECVEHLAISESTLGGLLEGALQAPANQSLRDSVSFSDNKLVAFITSRAQKVKTSEAFEPSGKFGSHKETLEAFIAKRNAHLDYLKTTEDDLRHHYSTLPFGTLDGVQLLLFISGHTERHVAQMEEVRAHANFPKSMK